MAEFPLEFLLQVKNEMSAGLTQATSQLKSMGSEAASSASKVKASGIGIGAGIALITTQLVSTANSIIGLKRQWEDLTRAQNNVKQSGYSLANAKDFLENATIKLGKAQKGTAAASKEEQEIAIRQFKLDMSKAKTTLDEMKARKRLNDVMNQGGKDAGKITIAENNLEKARRRVASATINEKEAQQNLKRAYEDFYLQTIPTMIGVVGSFATVLATLRGNTGTVMGSFLKFAPVLIGIGAAFFALQTNFLGITTFFQNLGRDIGNAVPAFRPLLNVIQELFAMIGIGESKKGGLNSAIGKFKKSFAPIIQGFKDFVDAIMKGNWSGAFKIIVNAAKGMWLEIKKAVPLIGDIESLVEKIKNGNWRGALLQIWVAAKAAWEAVKSAVPFLGDIEAFIKALAAHKWDAVFAAVMSGWKNSGLPNLIEKIFGENWKAVLDAKLAPYTTGATWGLFVKAIKDQDWKSAFGVITQGAKDSGFQALLDNLIKPNVNIAVDWAVQIIDAIATGIDALATSLDTTALPGSMEKMFLALSDENIIHWGTIAGNMLLTLFKAIGIYLFTQFEVPIAKLFESFWKLTLSGQRMAAVMTNIGIDALNTMYQGFITAASKSVAGGALAKALGINLDAEVKKIKLAEHVPVPDVGTPQEIRTEINKLFADIKKQIAGQPRPMIKVGTQIVGGNPSSVLRQALSNVQANQAKKNAAGFHGLVTGPTPLLVGERGSEQVDITPRADMMNRKQSSSTGTITVIVPVTLDGRVIAEVVAKRIGVNQSTYR